MFFGLLLCTACLGFDQPAATAARPPDIARVHDAYLKAKSQIGRNADDHVRLALWCEANQLEPERLKHLMIAVLKDPTHPTARGLLGLVAFADGWKSADAVTKKLDADETLAALRAEYSARRAKAGSSSDAHWQLALWCDRQGLKPEATAHLVAVTQLEPTRESAWKRLGYRLHAGRWITEAQLAAEKAEVQAQAKADNHWMPIMARWRKQLDEPAKSTAATRSLHGVVDPSAVPSVWAIFAVGKSPRHKMAVQILGQIDSPSSTGALSLLAVASASAEVRSKATQTLRMRDPRDSAATLVWLLRDPALDPDPILYHYFVQTVGAETIGSPGIVFVRGPQYDVLRYYTVDDSRSLVTLGVPVSSPSNGYASAVSTQTRRQAVDLAGAIAQILRESQAYVAAARLHVWQVNQVNARVVEVLSAVIGKDLGKDREAARKWWAEERGYAYDPPPPPSRQDLTFCDDKPTYIDSVHCSCFAADTPVVTLTGPRPIQSLMIGDQVLSQDPRTGALSYQPIVAALHNKPAMVIKITLDHDTIKATGIHRFWKAGGGWAMARDLKPGDRLRTLAGVAEVSAVQTSRVQPVFNLKVANAQTYFAGGRALLVHDSSLVEPVSDPFDAVPDLGATTTSPPF